MGETDLVPPMPPAATEPEEKKEKKGFLKKVFSKKKEDKKDENIDVPVPAPKKEEEKEVKKEPETKPAQESGSDIDEISKLIDDTISDIQKLQGSEEKPKAVEEPKKEEEVKEPAKIDNGLKNLVESEKKEEPAKKEPETKPEIKKAPEKKAVVVKKPVVKKAPAKKAVAVKKAVTKKAAKKPAKKSFDLPGFSATKKPAAKPKTKVQALEQRLNEAKSGSVAKNPFHLETGETLHSLQDLSKAMSKMSDTTWNHHVTNDRNDFANWIENELKNPALAKKFGAYFMKNDAIRTINTVPSKVNTTKVNKIENEIKFEKKMALPPKEFFKLNNKIITDVKDLEKAVNKLSQKEYSTYITRNKKAFANWLAFLTRGYKKESEAVHKKYNLLLTKVLADVNSQIDSKVKVSKSLLQKNAAEMAKIKTIVSKLTKEKNSMIAEQKSLASSKRNLMAEIAKVKKEHQQVHAIKEKTRLEKEQLYNDIKLSKEALRKEKADHKAAINEAKATAKKELAALSKQAHGLKAKIKLEESKIKKEWDSLKAKQLEISKRDQDSKKREHKVTKREDDFESEKLRIENLIKNFEEREKQIELQKSELEVAGFQKYLDSKLKELHTPETHESEFDKGIEEARILINNADIDSAKRKYLELKANFESSGVTGTEKERIFNILRELYDDIMLAVN